MTAISTPGSPERAAVLIERIDSHLAGLDRQAHELVEQMEADPALVKHIHDVLNALVRSVHIFRSIRNHLVAQAGQ